LSRDALALHFAPWFALARTRPGGTCFCILRSSADRGAFFSLDPKRTILCHKASKVASDASAGERRMTFEKILRTFRVCGITVEQCADGELVSATKLSAEQRRILNQLSLPTPAKILQQIHDPVPTS
jgi:hypothetical protein